VGQALGLDLDDLAGAWVAARVRLVAPNLERPEPAKLDPLASAHGLLQAVEDGVEQQFGPISFHLPLLGDAFDQVGSLHATGSALGIGISTRV